MSLAESVQQDEHQDTADPRIAATNGRRQRLGSAKAEYTWPGMMAWADWRKTRVHQYTKTYRCARCGAAFSTPHAVYAHLDRTHSAGGCRPAGGRVRASDTHSGLGGLGDGPEIRSRRLLEVTAWAPLTIPTQHRDQHR
jgi:hypothetical protein